MPEIPMQTQEKTEYTLIEKGAEVIGQLALTYKSDVSQKTGKPYHLFNVQVKVLAPEEYAGKRIFDTIFVGNPSGNRQIDALYLAADLPSEDYAAGNKMVSENVLRDLNDKIIALEVGTQTYTSKGLDEDGYEVEQEKTKNIIARKDEGKSWSDLQVYLVRDAQVELA